MKTIVSTAPSNPTQSLFFRAGVPGCENCATFHGDYISVTYGSDGKANMVWTDMRDPSDMPGLFSQFIYYAKSRSFGQQLFPHPSIEPGSGLA